MTTTIPTIDPSTISPRSMGVKLIIVGLLAAGMTVPALFVYLLIDDRTRRAEEVTRELVASRADLKPS